MNMKEARLKANISQTELAKRVKINQSEVSNIERGKVFPAKLARDAIDEALKARIDWSAHPNAPLTDIEKGYIIQLYERMIRNGQDPQDAMHFLSSQSNSQLRKLFTFAGLKIKPLSANVNIELGGGEDGGEGW